METVTTIQSPTLAPTLAPTLVPLSVSVNPVILEGLRKMSAEQRVELLNTIQQDERREAEELIKNPTKHLETKLRTVLEELEVVRNEIKILKNNNTKTNICFQSPSCMLETYQEPSRLEVLKHPYKSWLDIASEDTDTSETVSSVFDWWPYVIFGLIILSFLTSIPDLGMVNNRCRPAPLIV